MAKVKLTTENSIVNAVGKMAFTGNVIPESWYKTVVSANGRVNLLAVNLLGEIVYWYRPMEVRDERSGDVTWVKKFSLRMRSTCRRVTHRSVRNTMSARNRRVKP